MALQTEILIPLLVFIIIIITRFLLSGAWGPCAWRGVNVRPGLSGPERAMARSRRRVQRGMVSDNTDIICISRTSLWHCLPHRVLYRDGRKRLQSFRRMDC